MIAGLLNKSMIKASDRELKTLETLKLKKMHSIIFLEDTLVNRGKLRQLRKYISWSALSEETFLNLQTYFKKKKEKIIKKNVVIGLNCPYKGFPEKLKRTGYLIAEQFDLYLQKCVYRNKVSPLKNSVSADVV